MDIANIQQPIPRPAIPPVTEAGAARATPFEIAERRSWFDLNGDGRVDNVPASLGGDAYLPWDADGNGHVDANPVPRTISIPAHAPRDRRQAVAVARATYRHYGGVRSSARPTSSAPDPKH